MFRHLANAFRPRPIGSDGRPAGRSLLGTVGWLLWIGIFTIAVLIGGAVIWSEWANYNNYERHARKVSVIVARNPEICTDPEFPIHVRVLNGSSRQVRHLYVRVTAMLPGRSTDYADWQEWESDYIIEPGQVRNSCWKPILAWDHREDPGLVHSDVLVWSLGSFRVVFGK
jgi:hypothetical protein